MAQASTATVTVVCDDQAEYDALIRQLLVADAGALASYTEDVANLTITVNFKSLTWDVPK